MLGIPASTPSNYSIMSRVVCIILPIIIMVSTKLAKVVKGSLNTI